MTLEDTRIEMIEDDILIIYITREKVYNALRTNTLKEISSILKNCDESIRCVILTGSTKVFAAGADINELENKNMIDSLNDIRSSYWKIIKEFQKPIIAAINGFCLGGGCELAMSCDILIAGDNAKFGQPEINLGIIPGAGGTQRLTKALGKSDSMYYLLTGDFLSAKDALKKGLISEVLPAEVTLTRAIQIAKQIAKKSPLSTIAIKSAVLNSFDVGLSTSLQYEKLLFSQILSSNDKKEGILAFKQKREANFKGE